MGGRHRRPHEGLVRDRPDALNRFLAAVLVATLVGACTTDRGAPSPPSSPTRRTYGPARTTGRLRDPALTEVSGIVAARRTRAAFWVHNDSGGAPEIFCIRSTGRSCGTVTLTGAEAVDWEDIAADRRGHLYVGDIGDNGRERTTITVYRVVERAAPGVGETAAWPVERLDFTYPHRPFDAETLIVHPSGRSIYVVAKTTPAIVFEGDRNGGPLRVVGALRLPGLLSVPTAGDAAPDGRHAILTTYDGAFELTRRSEPFNRIWSARPRAVSLPVARQREAIAYLPRATGIVTTSEGVHAPVVERRLRT